MIYYPILLPCFLNFAFDISLPLPYTPWPQLRRLLALRQPCVPRNTRTKRASETEKGREREAVGLAWKIHHCHPHPHPGRALGKGKGEKACTVSWRVVTQRNKIKHAPKHIHPSRNIAYLVGNNSCQPAAPAPACCHPRIVARLGAKQKQCQQQWSQCRQHLCASPASPASLATCVSCQLKAWHGLHECRKEKVLRPKTRGRKGARREARHRPKGEAGGE